MIDPAGYEIIICNGKTKTRIHYPVTGKMEKLANMSMAVMSHI